jgi:AraC-like DNA-binding protein
MRQKLMEKFTSSPISNIPGIRTGCSDESLLKDLLNAIEANMIKSSFTVDDLAEELSLGPRTLHRKIKSLTGLNASQFLLMIKVKHAAKLIAENKATVSEAAYATGFSSLSHFTVSFRKITGMNPSGYRKTVV